MGLGIFRFRFGLCEGLGLVAILVTVAGPMFMSTEIIHDHSFVLELSCYAPALFLELDIINFILWNNNKLLKQNQSKDLVY